MDIRLVMFKNSGQRKDFPLLNPVTVIGRSEKCDLRVPLLAVSRRHCELRMSDGGLAVKDLASSNGTYVNNKRINEAALSAGDRLVVGPVVFTIQVDGVPGEIRPVKTRARRSAEAGRGVAEEIVDLEADIASQGGAAEAAAAAAQSTGEEIDPISALEALASEKPAEEQEKIQ